MAIHSACGRVPPSDANVPDVVAADPQPISKPASEAVSADRGSRDNHACRQYRQARRCRPAYALKEGFSFGVHRRRPQDQRGRNGQPKRHTQRPRLVLSTWLPAEHDECSRGCVGPRPRLRARRRIASTPPNMTFPSLLFFALLLCLRPAAAVFVPFSNCLPDSYIDNSPTLLQWVPLEVDASFTSPDKSERRTLSVRVWGNVTGSLEDVTLPPYNDPAWTDPDFTNGKILANPDENSDHPKLTTLYNKVNVLTYEPWAQSFNFCASLTNASCPLAPVFLPEKELLFPDALPSVSMDHDFYSSHAFTSFTMTFLIIYGNSDSTNIGCVSATITPDLGNLKWMLKFLPLLVLLFVGLATVVAGIFSPWGTTDIFHWTSNYGRDPVLLRLVTPGFGDCLQYIQFIALTGGLTLNYPGFYQPIVSQASWSTLMFNESFVSGQPGWPSVQDGIYHINGTYGLEQLAQLVGMANAEDIWAGMMVWVLVIIGSMIVLVQLGFLLQWAYRSVKKIPEEDLRSKNLPFTLGNVVRIVLNYFLLPIVALSMFQMVVAARSPIYSVVLAAVTIVLIIGFAIWLFRLITRTKPRAVLFDDLPTVLMYGPLYNTYSDEAAAFALVPFFCTFLRGIAIGAVEPAGVAQLVLLAICEVVQILTLFAFKPFYTPTSMNLYHILFSIARLITVLLMVSFVPSLGVTDGPKGWIGYVILACHAFVLVAGFFLNALQTMVEVAARMMGAGGDDQQGQTRGGLSRIFGMRQLSRRVSRGGNPSRASQLSTSQMLHVDETKSGSVIMGPAGHLRNDSAGSMGVLMHHRQRSSSANLSLDIAARNIDPSGTFTPTTPVATSEFSFAQSSPSGVSSRVMPPIALNLVAADPYYRPPRQKRFQDPTSSPPPRRRERVRRSWGSDYHQRHSQHGGNNALHDGLDDGGPPPVFTSTRTDYSTREADFYYGVRGRRLNSDAPNRKLGTGPADPTSPVASAMGWFKGMFGGKTKDKAKGFEVVRSARMPPAMRAQGGDYREAPPAGIPVAMGVMRNGPIDSDDDEERRESQPESEELKSPKTELLNRDGTARDGESADEAEPATRVRDAPPLLPSLQIGDSLHLPSQVQSQTSRARAQSGASDVSDDLTEAPPVPRKSSKRTPDHSRHGSAVDVSRLSATSETMGAESPGRSDPNHLAVSPLSTSSALATGTARLPFERMGSQRTVSGESSAGVTEDFVTPDEDRPRGFGVVHQDRGSITTVDGGVDLLGSAAEVGDVSRS